MATNNNVKGEESYLGCSYVTPNSLFTDTRLVDKTEVIVDPGEKVDYKFEELIKDNIKKAIKK